MKAMASVLLGDLGGSSGGEESATSVASEEEAPPMEVDACDPLDPLDRVPEPSKLLTLARHSRTLPDDDLHEDRTGYGYHIFRDKIHLSSLISEADRFNCARSTLRRERAVSVGLLWDMEREAWRRVEHKICTAANSNKNLKLQVYIECYMFDGVDLTVSVRRPLGFDHDIPPDSDDNRSEVAVEADADLEDRKPKNKGEAEIGPARLLNSTHSVCMVMQSGKHFQLLTNEIVTPLQALDRYTGENIKQALSRLCLANDDARLRFARRVRISMSDAAAYNLRAERHARGDSPVIHLLCDAHILAGVHQRVYSLAKQTIDKMVKTSYSLHGPGQISLFRKALRVVLARDLKLVHNRPPSDAVQFKNMVLDAFLVESPTTAPLRAVLLKCFSGDWRKAGVVEYLAERGETRRDALQALYKYAVPALLGRQPRVFPRHRWTKAEESIADLGIMANIHHLLHSTYEEFMSSSFPGKVGAVVGDAAAAAGQADDAAGQDQAPQDPKSAEARKHNRGAALGFVRDPFHSRDLVILATVLKPMAAYMRSEIDASSATRGVQEAFARMDRLEHAADIREFVASSRWALLEAANCIKDHEFIAFLSSLQDASRYESWPAHWKTAQSRSFVFKCFSRQGACVHELLHSKHRGCPYKIFQIVSDPTAGQRFLDEACESGRDQYTKSFLSHYAGKLDSTEALVELVAVLMHSKTSTVTLESSNATVRRRLVGTTVQAPAAKIEALSAEFVLGKYRRRQHEILHPAGHHRHMLKPQQVVQDSASAKRRGGGGSTWRAFLASKKQRVDDPALSAEYRDLSRVERISLEEQGRLATAIHRYGKPAFGPRSRVGALSGLVY